MDNQITFHGSDTQWFKTTDKPLEYGRLSSGDFYTNDQGDKIFLKQGGTEGPWYEKAAVDVLIYLGAKIAPGFVAKWDNKFGFRTGFASVVLAKIPLSFEEYIKTQMPPWPERKHTWDEDYTGIDAVQAERRQQKSKKSSGII